MWADVELLVMTGLRPLLPGVRVVDELPDRLEDRVPLVSVLVVGGGDDRITDTATVDLASFAKIVPYGNPAVRRAVATYTVSARARAAT
ncbi:hypothetical protein JHN62_12915 [Streptomyces sp. MBT54]|nr:hypothetical protein [Streptomyces sp. MBT54]